MTALLERTQETVLHTSHAAEQRWCQVVPHLHARYGGLSTAVPALAHALEAESIQSRVAAFCAAEDGDRAHWRAQQMVRHWPANRLQWMRNRSLVRELRGMVAGADGVHIHGLWEQASHAAADAALHAGRPYVLSAHGMLEPWALRNKQWKKRVYSALVERRVVGGAACLHALTRAEAQNYFDYLGRRHPVAIIPNGVEAPAGITPDLFHERVPAAAGKRVVLFLGRLHPKKGVDLLVEAWEHLAEFQDAYLVLAGPDDGVTRARLEGIVAQRGMQQRVCFTGMMDAPLKWSALAAAELMVLPSHSEGLSVSVLEALAAAVPVLLTPQCNMPEIEAAGAGWLCRPSAAEVTVALRSVLQRDASANAAAGQKGLQLAREVYSWPRVAAAMAEVYRWVTGGPLPQLCEVLQ